MYHSKPKSADKPEKIKKHSHSDPRFVTTADVQRMYNKLKKSGRSEAHPIHGPVRISGGS